MVVTIARGTAAGEIKVPVGMAFEQRLAELVWENCPELARQTAAGQLALTLNFQDTTITKRVVDDLVGEICREVKEQATEAAKAAWADEKPVKDVVVRVRSELEKRVEKELGSRIEKAINDLIQGYLSDCMYDRVQSAANSYFEGGSFANVIQERVDGLVQEHLDKRLSTNSRTKEAIRTGAAKLNK